MDFEEVFQVVDAAVVAKKQRHLKDVEVAILRESWQGKKYHEIAEAYGYTAEYLKQDVGPKLWKLLSEVLGEKVSKTNFHAALERNCQLLYKNADLAYSLRRASPYDRETKIDYVSESKKSSLLTTRWFELLREQKNF